MLYAAATGFRFLSCAGHLNCNEIVKMADKTSKNCKLTKVYAICVVIVILHLIYASSFYPSGNRVARWNSSYFDRANESAAISSTSRDGVTSTTISAISMSKVADNQECGYLVADWLTGAWRKRLGNGMSTYATLYGLVKYQESVGANKTYFLRVERVSNTAEDIFENLTLPQRIVPKEWVWSNKFRYIDTNVCCRYRFTNMSCDGKNFMVHPYSQSYKYYLEYFDEIKREFTFKSKIRKKSRELIESSLASIGLNRNQSIIVGVHMRRGDFTYKHKMAYGHSPATVDYLERAANFFELWFYKNSTNAQQHLIFLVFGNDYDWNLNSTRQVQLLNPNRTHWIVVNHRDSSSAIDMCTIQLCDHAAISTGSYGWWSAAINKGMVTYQKEYAMPNTKHYKEYEPKDHILPHWIPL